MQHSNNILRVVVLIAMSAAGVALYLGAGLFPVLLSLHAVTVILASFKGDAGQQAANRHPGGHGTFEDCGTFDLDGRARSIMVPQVPAHDDDMNPFDNEPGLDGTL